MANASSGDSILSTEISETWTSPSTPLPIVTNAPKGTTFVTSPSTTSPSLKFSSKSNQGSSVTCLIDNDILSLSILQF